MGGAGKSRMRVIAGQAHGRHLSAPRGLVTRPPTARVRQSIFSRLVSRFDFDNARVLDLFAGSGSLGIEALSHGAAYATFIDSSPAATATILKNLRAIELQSQASVITLDVRRALRELAARKKSFDLVFIDAPYRRDLSDELLARLAEGRLLASGGWVVVRQSGSAPKLAAVGFTCVSTATMGGHRIALYRRSVEAAEANH
jgi:16S rRNA (guanine966-N2)-methyltransferase